MTPARGLRPEASVSFPSEVVSEAAVQELIDVWREALSGLVRLVEGVDVASAPDTGAPIRFDLDRLYFFGHSQGAITGALS